MFVLKEKIMETTNLINLAKAFAAAPARTPTQMTTGNNALNNSSNLNFFWTMFIYIAVIAFFVFALVFARKYLLKRLGGVKSGTYMKILDRLVISQDKQIILVAAGNKMLVVGVSQQKIETLAEFSKDELGEISVVAEPEGNAGGSFGTNFLSLLRKKLNKNDNKNENEK